VLSFEASQLPAVLPPPEACDLAISAAEAVGGPLVGIDLLPADLGTWVVLEVNGAVDFNSIYSLDEDVFAATAAALRGGVVEPVSAFAAEPAGLNVLAQ